MISTYKRLPSSAQTSTFTNFPVAVPSNMAEEGGSLQRGTACLVCRAKKMKCDAGKPSCGPCTRIGKASECVYDTLRPKSRTQALQDKIKALEQQVQLMEHGTVRPVPSQNATDSSMGGPGDFPGSNKSNIASLLRSYAHFSSGPTAPVSMSRHNSGGHREAPFNRSTSTGPDPGPSHSPPPPIAILFKRLDEHPQNVKEHLFDVFIQNRFKFAFDPYLPRFRSRLSVPSDHPDAPHPALLNAIYLCACLYSPGGCHHEQFFLNLTRDTLNESLAHADRLFDFLVASTLLGFFFYLKGRWTECHHTSSGAMRFAVACRLHEVTVAKPDQFPPSILPPPRDEIEAGERITMFWSVFLLDRGISIVGSYPLALPDERITTVWPTTYDHYQSGRALTLDYGTVTTLYQPDNNSKFSALKDHCIHSLRAKAVALFQRSTATANSLDTNQLRASEAFLARFFSTDAAIAAFIGNLPPIPENIPPPPSGLAAETTSLPGKMNLIQFLARGGYMLLHGAFAEQDEREYGKVLRAAEEMAVVLRGITAAGMPPMCYVAAFGWTSACEVLIREMERLDAWGAPASSEAAVALKEKLEVIWTALKGARCIYTPLATEQLEAAFR